MNERLFKHQLDAKNRMRIPAKLKEGLSEGYTIMLGAGECLSVITKSESLAIQAKLAKASRFDSVAQKSIRKFIANLWDAEEDNQGRILIPEHIRKAAHIEKNVIILNNLSGIEIWAEEEWNKFMAEEDDYDAMLANIDKLMQVSE